MRSDTSEPLLVPKRSVDRITGEPKVDYYWDNELAPKVKVEGKLIRQLDSYALIKKDLDNALKWIIEAESLALNSGLPESGGHVHLKDRESGDLIKALFVASLTFYGKCFTTAADGSTRASRSWLDENYRDTHDFYMRYRHSFAAHSGADGFEAAESYVLVHPNRNELLPFMPTLRIQHDIAIWTEEGTRFSELIEHAGSVVALKYDKVVEKIGTDLVLPKGIGFWVTAANEGRSVSLELPSTRRRRK